MIRVLIVDDDTVDREQVRRALETMDEEVVVEEAIEGRGALERLSQVAFDCLILDYRLPDLDGLQFLQMLIDGASMLPVPVLMLTGEGNEMVAVQAMKMGVYDYLVKESVTPAKLHVGVRNAIRKADLEQRLAKANDEIHHMAMYDALTGLGNRYLFEDKMDNLLAVAKRNSQPFALFIVDLDRFKMINDRHGHMVGDRVLAEIGNRLKSISRLADMIFRVGGDEFAVLVETGATQSGVMHYGAKIVEEIRQPIEMASDSFRVGVSVGIAIYPDHGTDEDSLMHHADAAMYAAKRGGGGIGFATLEEA